MESNLKIDTLIIPLDTDHLEEYPAVFDHILKRIIHFNGSAGTLILNKSDNKIRHIFVTDSRYEIIGERIVTEMRARGVELELKIIKPKESHLDCLKELGCHRVGVNLKRLGIAGFQKLITTIKAEGIESINVPDEQKIEPSEVFNFFETQTDSTENTSNILVDLNIFKSVPRPNQSPFSLETSITFDSITHFDLNFSVPKTGNDLICGETHSQKFSRLFKDEIENKTVIFTALHEINYMLNIRTTDATYSPHLYCFMIATRNKAQLYCNWNTKGLFNPSNDLLIETKRYEDFFSDAKALIKQNPEDILLSSPNSYLLSLLLKDTGSENLGEKAERIIKKQTTKEVKKMMDKKNLNELKGFTQAGLIHGISLIKLFVELEALAAVNQKVSEKEVAKILNRIFESNPDFLMISFKSIVGSGKNGASIHHETSDNLVNWDEPLLLDCGLQTKYGTTDISRTLLINDSKVKKEFKDDYTLILRAQINGKLIKGKPETMKYLTQFVPRYFVNQKEEDYKHGTGHGIGHCGCVHEETEFLEGSVFSVEPGIYKKGSYGIRLEDVVTCQLINSKSHEDFLSLTPLTFVPYQRNLINENLLTSYEKEYLNGYNEMLRKVLKPFLKGKELKYLEINTQKF